MTVRRPAEALLRYHASGAAVDRHLADQMLLPLSFAAGPSHLLVERVTRHLETNAWIIEQFGVAKVEMRQLASGTAEVLVTPQAQ